MRNPSTTQTILLSGLAWAVLAACGGKSAPADAPVATVNGRDVLSSEFSAYLKIKRIPEQDPSARQHVLQEYAAREALADVIERESLLDKSAIDAELRERKKELLISRYFEQFLDDKASAQAIKNYYDAHAADYEERKVHVAHILFRLNRSMTPEQRAAKLTAAHDAAAQLKAGKDFAELARELSEDQISSKKGGDLGFLREGSVDPAFSKRAFELAKDEVSEPVETQFGFHIIKALEPPQVIKKPLEAVQGDIRYQLRASAKQAEMDRLMAKTKVDLKGASAKPQAKPEEPAGEVAKSQ